MKSAVRTRTTGKVTTSRRWKIPRKMTLSNVQTAANPTSLVNRIRVEVDRRETEVGMSISFGQQLHLWRNTRKCRICEREKTIEQYGWKDRKRGRRETQCKKCKAIGSRINWAKDSKEKNEYQRRYHRSHPYISRAHSAVKRALEIGTLTRKPCEISGCTDPLAEAHHEDYSKPLDVIWLCRSHHRIHHSEVTV